ncbi:hypothetical protein Patl1_26033 [Pistacia atlantica]|uniref:Uncharacterized protein n=1 Tax=Pistacia atlantica TaxID=434234 RepID=A0ACC1B4V5_9ROSI|nr:hypothetical protein Patl1_26033 [Pistacia atlantica]
MYGNHRPRFCPGGRGGSQPPPQSHPHPHPPQLNPNFALQNPNVFSPNLQLLQNLTNIPLQSPNFPFQNPNFPLQSPPFPIQNLNLPSQQLPYNPSNHSLQTQTPISTQPQRPKREVLERVESAVVKARSEIIAARESVSAWKVCESVLLKLKVDSWSSLGFQMQEVPSLSKIMVTESKINAFIHCFVGVRKITSLYDLEVAICKNEGIKKFEELELGPFLRHPLVLHYFSVNCDVTEVFKITTHDIIVCLSEYMDTHIKKDINVDEFLNLIAKKQSLASKEKLGVRIQNLGMHINFIREARRSEDVILKKYWEGSQPDHKRRKRRIFSSHRKKQLDERFSAICERVKSFSSVHEDFGKHIRFVSSGSEDEDSDDCSNEGNNDVGCHFMPSSRVNSSDQVGSCPYPSATEEIARLGLKGEMNHRIFAVGSSSRQDENIGSLSKKRKFGNQIGPMSAPAKLLKKKKVKQGALPVENDDDTKDVKVDEAEISLSEDCMRMFITTWKEACRDYSVTEVFERMLQFYKPTDPKKAAHHVKRLKLMFLSYPCIGLLNIAVASIKSGMWDSVYDTLQAISQQELANTLSDKYSEFESIEVEPSKQVAVINTEHIVQPTNSVTAEQIIRKVSTYFEMDHEILSNGESALNRIFVFLRKLCNCETWLAEQFSVKEFKSLGFGEFFVFLEKYTSLLPIEMHKFLLGVTSERSPLEVSLLNHLLIVLVSQASNSLWENETITKQMISALLVRQFPLLSFKIVENGSMENFLEIVGKHKNYVISKCIVFSETLLGISLSDSLAYKENILLETNEVRTDTAQRTRISGSVTSKDAIEVLLRAPMLSELNSWSHWELVYAPSLGPLLEWLLNEVSVKELFCLVTKEGKVIRIDHSATVDSFFGAALEGSSFQTAVKLLSSFALAGGGKHAPLSLLKRHAQHAFEVIFKNNMENVDGGDCQNSVMHGKVLSRQAMLDEVAMGKLSGEVHNQLIKLNKAVPIASRFVLDCLSYLPSEFHGFAADVLLFGLRSIIKDAPSAILSECNQIEERVMLHEVGLSLGIVEWIHDYREFCSTPVTDLLTSCGTSCLEAARSELHAGLRYMQNAVGKYSCTKDELIGADGLNEVHSEVHTVHCDAPPSGIDNCFTQPLYGVTEYSEAAQIVESIRREEFGLDQNLSNMESIMLKKQHARLGRALHCLSQELYSQDSHFLLELVQNADDNIYPENVEPTLTFILQESGIIVLNNELGFSAQNIRALCDVGNSTKKGSGAGYIGQKGIGFKSVFRVTDAPEIHSNGFHVKFDISEGQIGFVLPTVVAPCNIDMFCSLVSKDPIQLDSKCWNTCIRLPFRSKFI